MAKQLTVDDIVRKADGVPALAGLLGVTPQTVYGWVALGAIPGSRLPSISAALDIPPERLLPLLTPPRRTRKQGRNVAA